jgi:DNA-binding GntR family transcriptional regulator
MPASPKFKSLHQEVANSLRERIFSGQLLPGDFLDENQLCELLAISRTPLREALKVLTAEGLLRHEPRRGCFVNQVTEQDLDDIFPVLAILEGRCAFEASNRATEADLVALEGMHRQLEQFATTGQLNEYYVLNFQIHEVFIALAGNHWLSQMIGDLRKVLKLSRQQQLRVPGRLMGSLKEHQAIFAAMKERDSVVAEQIMRRHIESQREALKQLQSSDLNPAIQLLERKGVSK